MPGYEHYHDTVHWQMAEITSRIIAESGIPSDRFHLGKIILQGLKDSPDLLAQIEGTTEESENNSSLLRRTIQCAVSLKKMGFQTGDVMILMAPNHLDLVVPFYAAMYLGIKVAPIDRFLGISELMGSFTVTSPKIIFCQSEKVGDIRKSVEGLEVKPKVITFDGGDGDITFSELLEQGDGAEKVAEFRPADFDPNEAIAMLIATSGTTGLPKHVAISHKSFVMMAPYLWARTIEIPPFTRSLIVAPLQWMTAVLNFLCAPFMKYTRVQSYKNATQDVVYEMINRHRPKFLIISPTMMMTLVKPGDRDKCDFTCFERIMLGGSAVSSDLLAELKKVTPKTEVLNAVGMSEVTSPFFVHGFSSPPISCGKPVGCLQYRLIDIEKRTDINEPNVNGELWLTGPGLFKGYYNNPEATKEAHEGIWFKTGDMFYRDENWNFYFVDRIKLLLKYRNHQISPVEVEAVIRHHPGVLDVAVTGIPDPECGELPVACVVPIPGATLTAQEIKDLVKESLTETKQLRGGVIFLEKLPVTSSTKISRREIKEIALTMKRE